MNNRISQFSLVAAMLLMHASPVVHAEDHLLNFSFSHMTNMNQSQLNQNASGLSSEFEKDKNALAIQFKQYDATLTYPLSAAGKSSSMDIDVGVTLRHLTGYRNSEVNAGNSFFQETLPLFHASAFYNFSFKGLSAGVESTHLAYKQKQFLDYKAQVSYEWRKGFGLQGGWQHQQFRLDNSDQDQTGFTQQGPFLDFYLNF